MRRVQIKAIVIFSFFLITTTPVFAKAVSILNNPFQYSSEYTDPESSLQYLTARYYDAKIIRFVEQDSFDLLNRYSYASGNPITNEDPSVHLSSLVETMLGFSSVPTSLNEIWTLTNRIRENTVYRFDAIPLTLLGASAITGITGIVNDDQSLAIASIATFSSSFGANLGFAIWLRQNSIEQTAQDLIGLNELRLENEMNNLNNIQDEVGPVLGVPQVEPLQVELPLEAPLQTESPQIELPQVAAPQVESPQVELPSAEPSPIMPIEAALPQAESASVEIPPVEKPPLEAPQAELPETASQQVAAPVEAELPASMQQSNVASDIIDPRPLDLEVEKPERAQRRGCMASYTVEGGRHSCQCIFL